MQQAVKMKTAQSAPDRNKFDTWPRFYQNSIFAKDEVIAARKMEFLERKDFCEKMKVLGNGSLEKGDMMDANHCYEQALAVFKFAENTNPDWKNKGIKDDDLTESSFEIDTIFNPQQVREIESLLLACYLNLAYCCHQMQDFDVAILACDAALEISPQSAKAFYRRALARVGPPGAGGLELDQAVVDLRHSQNVGGDKMVGRKLRELIEIKRKQARSDKKTFTGMFSRGEVYEGGASGGGNRGASGGDGKGAVDPKAMPDDPIEKQV